MIEQRVMTHAQWVEQGGWEPLMVDPTDDWVVIAAYDDETGAYQWASWDAPDVDPADRVNPDVTVVDMRAT